MTKYLNKKITNQWGEFDSKLEASRFIYLQEQEKQGRIRNLRRQVDYELIPNQIRQEVKQLKTKTKLVDRVVERACHYKADFAYEVYRKRYVMGQCEDYWESVVEDTKGGGYSRGYFSTQTPDFRIKKKLMLYVHGIEVKIVNKPTQEI